MVLRCFKSGWLHIITLYRWFPWFNKQRGIIKNTWDIVSAKPVRQLYMIVFHKGGSSQSNTYVVPVHGFNFRSPPCLGLGCQQSYLRDGLQTHKPALVSKATLRAFPKLGGYGCAQKLGTTPLRSNGCSPNRWLGARCRILECLV